MDFSGMTDKQIEMEIGRRFKALRLRANMTQAELGAAACRHRNAVVALESGSGSQLSTLIAVLRELGAVNQRDLLIHEVEISPLQLARMKGRQRKRASGAAGKRGAKAMKEGQHGG